MTKRSLLIIIAILIVADLAAGFWYWSGHFNSDGRSADLFSSADSVTDADTLGGNTTPDRYALTDKFSYFVSQTTAVPGNELTRYTCVKRFKARIPQQINGSADIQDLLTELNRVAFSHTDAGISASASEFLSKPTFTTTAQVAFKQVAAQPTTHPTYGYVESVKIYPAFASANFLSMAVDRQTYNGSRKVEQLQFVAYARTLHHLLTFAQMFDPAKPDALLAAINGRINYRNVKGHHNFRQAKAASQNMLLRADGVTFIYDPGQLATTAVQVFVPYKDLNPALTTEMANLIATDTAGHDFDPITFHHK